MFGTALILFRETLEAALFVGILAAATRDLPQRWRLIGMGVGIGTAGSGLMALASGHISQLADGLGADLLNAIILCVAFIMLAWHCISSAQHGREMSSEARQIGHAVAQREQARSAVVIAIALTVLREGAEAVLFILGYVSGHNASPQAVLLGGGAGLAAGIATGVAMYLGLSRIPGKHLFSVTNKLILLFAAALAAQLARTLTQAGWLQTLSEPLWDTSGPLPMTSPLGVLLHALVGYDARPSGMELLFYVGGLLLIVAGTRLSRPRTSNAPKSPSHSPQLR